MVADTMGTVFSFFFGSTTGRIDDPDPVTGLTSRDKYIIKTTWDKLTTGEETLKTGQAIFLNLFEKHPEYKLLFPFKDIPKDQLKDHPRFKAHCVSVVYSLSSIVSNVETPALLEQLLAKQGSSHVPRNVPRAAYGQLKDVLMGLFAVSMNQEELKTWDKFLGLGFSIIEKSADSANQQ